VTHEASWYLARCLDVDVVSQGVTVDEALANLKEALANLKEALELYFETKRCPRVLKFLLSVAKNFL
jgi:predicted RNase H-like HicB family nuclease